VVPFRQRLARFAFLAVIVQIPFELRSTFLGLSNLQWSFVFLFLLCAPDLVRNWKQRLSDRLIQAGALFIAIQWLAALAAPAFHANAFKGAARFTAGFALVVMARQLNESRPVFRVWAVASLTAAVYALMDYTGFGITGLFRMEEFFIGQVQRLSGSFEYPNTAAAYFAMSLPLVWWSAFRPVVRGIFSFVLWCVVILTFSKGALLALFIVSVIALRSAAISKLAIGAVAYAVLLPVNPYLIERVAGLRASSPPLSAEYDLQWNHLEQQPGMTELVPLKIRNTGITTIRANGRLRSAVSYRWFNTGTNLFSSQTPIVTPLPRDIAHGDTLNLEVRVETPREPGKYWLAIELFSRNFDWFSRTGVWPTIVDTDIRANASRTVGNVDLSALYKDDSTRLTAGLPRRVLWKAAFMMFTDHPMGVGPDNYRLQYGTYLGASGWDTNIYSNNLYLELLTGSGVLGLLAFSGILVMRQWHQDVSSIAVAIFLVHGFVDYFLMTTPLYFAFWILLGLERTASGTSEAVLYSVTAVKSD
jgi:hypothetical protein